MQRHLEHPRAGYRACALPELLIVDVRGERIGGIGLIRNKEHGMVQHVERLGSECQLKALRDMEVLLRGKIPVKIRRPGESVQRKVTYLAGLRVAETARDRWNTRQPVRRWCPCAVRAYETWVDDIDGPVGLHEDACVSL